MSLRVLVAISKYVVYVEVDIVDSALSFRAYGYGLQTMTSMVVRKLPPTVDGVFFQSRRAPYG